MSEPIANPPRLSSLSDGEDSLGIGRMFCAARELGEEELPRLRWRVRTSQQLRAMRPRLILKVTLVVGIAFFMGGVVGAVVSPFFPPFLARRKSVAVVSPPTETRSAEHRRPRRVPLSSMTEVQPETPPAATESAEVTGPVLVAPVRLAPGPIEDEPKLVPARPKLRKAPTGAGAVALEPAPVTVRPAIAPPPVTLFPVASAIAVEQTLLGQAMRTLRGGRDARTALALLEQHEERFPQGAFASEATELRIEALLALGQRDEALAVLDRAPLASLPNRDEQRVVRGELRATHQRWREAARDFDDALAERGLPAPSPKVRRLQERALWGRAAARSRLGDPQGARADLDLYGRCFPGGQFAAQAAALLKGAP